MEKKITLKQAYMWVSRKWNYIVKNNGSEAGLLEKYPKLQEFVSECAYCELFIYKGCVDCPLEPKEDRRVNTYGRCWETYHPWHKWYKNNTKDTAQEVLNLIRKTNPS